MSRTDRLKDGHMPYVLKSSVALCSCERMLGHIVCWSGWVEVKLGVRGSSVAEGILRVT